MPTRCIFKLSMCAITVNIIDTVIVAAEPFRHASKNNLSVTVAVNVCTASVHDIVFYRMLMTYPA